MRYQLLMATDIPESHRDLLQTNIASLTTIGRDGSPQATIIWFLFEDGKLKFSLDSGRQKTHNIARDPRVSLMIPDPDNSLRYLEIRGNATAVPDPDYVFADRLGRKYGGADLRVYDEPGAVRYEVSLDPVKVFAVALG